MILRAFELAAVVAIGTALAGEVAAQDDWSARKCALYEAATADALTVLGTKGIRREFLARNRAFIAKGCFETVQICAVTPEEYALADLLTVMTMNEGMASTFVPFDCPS